MSTPVQTPFLDSTRYAMELAEQFVTNTNVAPEQMERMLTADVGQTPSEVIYEENKVQLRKYTPEEVTQETPIVIVYALINRPFILDLQPGMSVIQTLLSEGFEVYMIDWGEPSRLDQSLTFEDYVCRYMNNCLEEVCADADVDDVHLLGYCMGGTLSVIYSALEPERVRTLGTMALAFNFDGDSGIYENWAEPIPIEDVADTLGNFPSDPMAVVFSMRDPVQTMVTRFVDLYDRLDETPFIESYARMEQWSWEGVDIAGETFAQFVGDVVQDNKLARNEMTVGDQHVDVESIDVPVMQVIGEEDGIAPPNCCRPLEDAVGTDDYTEFSWPTGHFGVSISPSAHQKLWPKVADWYAERSAGEEDTDETADEHADAHENGHSERDVESIDGIGPTYAERLQEAGIESVTDLTDHDSEELADIAQTSPSRTEEWLAQAT